MLFRLTCVLRKQTKNPPKRVVPIDQNPLARWSRQLPRWSTVTPSMPNTYVGLEGCNSAFNATNSIRTCLFFGTGAPPCFLSVHRWGDIEHVQTRHDELDPTTTATTTSQSTDAAARRHFQGAEMKDLALFGEEAFLSPIGLDGTPLRAVPPLVAIENFTDRSESLFRRRFPRDGWRMVVGHENWGVRSEFIHGTAQADDQRPRLACSAATEDPRALKAEAVLYVPQYGTITSLNVVTSLGIALFYALLDQCFPASRTLVTGWPCLDEGTSPTAGASLSVQDLLHYQRQFTSSLPSPTTSSTDDESLNSTSSSSSSTTSERPPSLSSEVGDIHRNTSPRVDARPIHPLYYHGDKEDIRQRHHHHRRALLSFSHPDATSTGYTGFGLSVLYENEFDQRNFGGLVRNANGFLVDHIFYVGRRKFNVVGAVGSNHYTPPEYLGPCCADNNEDDTSASEEVVVAEWSDALQRGVQEAAHGASLRWWLLDIGHEHLYKDSGAATGRDRPGDDHEVVTPRGDRIHYEYYSSAASLAWYRARIDAPDAVLTLCDTEDVLADAARDGVLLVVPQEGKLPHIGILRHCEKILRVTPASHCPSPAGLPSQVASGIALQRLSVIMHPRVRLLS